ncbi:hypothetical protein ABZP36_021308 [Zizania latifolia]
MAAPGSLGVYKVVFAALGLLMVGTLVYTCVTDGSPFRLELLRFLSMEEDWMSVTDWWMGATLIDSYVNVIDLGPSHCPLDLLLLRAFIAAVVIYNVITDGLPFRKDLLTP